MTDTIPMRRLLMEGNGRRLPWIAIAISAVALLVALGGRMGPRAHMGWGPQGAYGPMAGQVQPAQPPQGWTEPRGDSGMQGQFGNRMKGHFDQRFSQDFRGPGPFGHGRGFGPPAFFFWPFMILGKLLKLAFVVLLIWL